MTVLGYLPVREWWGALVIAAVASLCSGRALIEIRKDDFKAIPVAALFFSQCAAVLSVPSLSPPLVTGVSGAAMCLVLISDNAFAKSSWTPVAASCIIAAGVIMVAIDVEVTGKNQASGAAVNSQVAFWVVAGLLSLSSAIATAHLTWSRFAATWVMVGSGFQDVISTSLVYMCMSPQHSNAALLPLLLVSGLFGIYIARSSLTANAAAMHMSIAYAVYNFGVWFTAPAVTAMTIHGGPVSAVGGTLCVCAAILLIYSQKNGPTDRS